MATKTLDKKWLLYGAYGYTGQLIAETARAAGLKPILSGRDAGRVDALAKRLGLEARPFALGDAEAIEAALADVDLVLHAAGPFVETAAIMRAACLNTKTHYLDITGEMPVFQESFAQDAAARRAGVTVMSGVGFDVVPTDCLAVYVAQQLDAPQSLDLAICSTGAPSGGTLKSALLQLPKGNFVRRGGALLPQPLGQGARTVRFPHARRQVMPIPWGDLVTAYASTGIPNITTYAATPPKAVRALRLGGGLIRTAMKSKRIQTLARKRLDRRPDPTADERAASRSYVWACARDAAGREAEAWLELSEGYTFTAAASVACVRRVLGGDAPAGATTPASAFGADFVLTVPGCTRHDTLEI